MKSILISIKPKWVAKILNGEKKVEVRKGTALYKTTKKLIDEYGFAEFYVYCTKGLPLIRYIEEKVMFLSSSTNTIKNERESGKYLNGKVAFKFRCYKVEEIEVIEDNNYYENDFDYYYSTPTCGSEGDLLVGFGDRQSLNELSCLDEEELDDYLQGKKSTAIRISDLEIFDKPKELSEFCGVKQYFVGCESGIDKTPRYAQLTKAPQSWCYIETGE